MITALTIAGVATVTGIVAAAPAEAASKIVIVRVKFDSDGNDLPVTNAKLNDEYVIVKNTDTRTRTITNWTLRDVANHRYTFPATTIRSGASIRVFTGSGTNTASRRYMNRGYYVWNNTSDTAYLRNTTGGGGDTCSWRTSDPGNSKIC